MLGTLTSMCFVVLFVVVVVVNLKNHWKYPTIICSVESERLANAEQSC